MIDIWRCSSEKTCKNCLNWGGHSAANRVGPCKAHAPGPQGFPGTNANDVCGDFAPSDFYVPKETLDLMKEVERLRIAKGQLAEIFFLAELFEGFRKARLTRESNT